MVRAEGVEPSRAEAQRIFIPSTAFAARRRRFGAPRPFCGLDYPFTLPRKIRGLGAARLVSTPSRLRSLRAWLGIAILGFPEFEQFCIAGFPDEHSSFPCPLRMPTATPARDSLTAFLS